MANCSDNTYYIYYADPALGVIAIPKSALDQTTLDITLLGKTRLEYGEVFNENLVHLMEHFAVEQDGSNEEPNLSQTYATLLANPVIGQLWYNKTNNCVYVCADVTPVVWERISNTTSVAGSSGMLAHGETIPLPVSPDGYEFTAAECVWHLSPYYGEVDAELTGFNIEYSVGRVVTAEYFTASDTFEGLVNYIILGVRDQPAPSQINVP